MDEAKMREYEAWIDANVADAYGACKEATENMARAFPELTRVRGHYYCVAWGERAHWWLTTPDGSIIDPTRAQFPSGGRGHYEPWPGGEEEPTGMCPECGGPCYQGDSCCSRECFDRYVAYLNVAW